jgi:FOG: Ankyrin repeat
MKIKILIKMMLMALFVVAGYKNMEAAMSFSSIASHNHGDNVKALFKAVAADDFVTARYLIEEEGVSVNANLPEVGHTVLHTVVTNLEMAQFLFEHGADVHARDCLQGTPLHAVIYGGYPAMVELHVQRGADVNAQDQWRQTPLRLAVHNGYLAIVRLLLSAGAIIDAETLALALDNAEDNGESEIAQLLEKAFAMQELERANAYVAEWIALRDTDPQAAPFIRP